MASQDYKVKMLVPEQLKWDEQKTYGTRVGNTSNVYERYTSRNQTGVISPASTVKYSEQPGSNVLVSSIAWIEADLEMEFSATSLTLETISGNWGVRPMALNRVIESASVTPNGSTRFSSSPSEMVGAPLYGLDADTLARLSDASLPDYNYEFNSNFITDPLRAAENAVANKTRGLGSLRVLSADATDNVVTIKVRLSERLCASPFQWAAKEVSPLVGLNNLDVSLGMGSNFDKGMVNINNSSITTLSVDNVTLSNMELVLQVYSPSLQIQYPLTAYWDIPYISEYNGETKSITSGGTATLKLDSKVLDQVFKACMVYVVEDGYPNNINSDIPIRMYDADSLDVSLGSRKNQFLSWSPEDLYLMSKKNGYNGAPSSFFGRPGDFDDSRLGTGSVIIFTPSDMGLEENVVSNANMTYTFSAKVTVTNNSSSTKSLQLRIVTIDDGIMTYHNGRYTDEKATILPFDLTKAELDYHDTSYHQNVGNGFLSNLWRKAKSVATHPFTKSLSKAVRNAPYLDQYVGDNTAVGKLASSQGYGGRGNVLTVGGAEASNDDLDDLIYQ